MTNFILYAPSGQESQCRYISDVVFGEFLGLKVLIKANEMPEWRLTDSEGHYNLIMPDSFFSRAKNCWHSPQSLPISPLPVWKVYNDLPEAVLVSPEMPIIEGRPSPQGLWFSQNNRQSAYLGLDVLGAAFFMLTRYEELVLPDRDEHGRFPSRASIASKNGFLERPIIDEYVEILYSAMRRLWPSLKQKQDKFNLVLSHDVDEPFEYQRFGRLGLLRASAGDFIKRREPLNGLRRAASAFLPARLQRNIDPNNTFDWLMGQSEKFGISSTFNFVAGSSSLYDPIYNLEDKTIRQLIREISNRGHKIGLHGSYSTMKDGIALAEEYKRLVTVAREENVQQEEFGGRQHYLRWDVSCTWRICYEAGLVYDSTLGYADRAGFRCGTAKGFTVFDLLKNRPLELKEVPLIVMERSLLSEKYEGLGELKAMTKIIDLINAVRCVNGTFTLLWHNSSLQNAGLRSLYQKCLEACS